MLASNELISWEPYQVRHDAAVVVVHLSRISLERWVLEMTRHTPDLFGDERGCMGCTAVGTLWVGTAAARLARTTRAEKCMVNYWTVMVEYGDSKGTV
jgi:hypothetical protein